MCGETRGLCWVSSSIAHAPCYSLEIGLTLEIAILFFPARLGIIKSPWSFCLCPHFTLTYLLGLQASIAFFFLRLLEIWIEVLMLSQEVSHLSSFISTILSVDSVMFPSYPSNRCLIMRCTAVCQSIAIVQLWKQCFCKTEPQYYETLTLHASPLLSPCLCHLQAYNLRFLNLICLGMPYKGHTVCGFWWLAYSLSITSSNMC